MKLDRLASTTQHNSPESRERVRHVADQRIRQIDAMEGAGGDRQRSLQQEMSEIEPAAIGDFNGADHVLQDAHELAMQVAALGAAADHLIKAGALPVTVKGIDDTA